MKIAVYDKSGKKSKEINFAESKEKISSVLISEVIRIGNLKKIAPRHAKTRSERRGSGRKPWRQKGTGRARVGTAQSPIWRKGGVVFGPTKVRNYLKKVNKKNKTKVKVELLGLKAKEKEMIIWDIKSKDIPKKTKEAEKALFGLPLKEGQSLILYKKEQILKPFANIPYLDLKKARSLSAADIIKYKNIIVTLGATSDLDIKKS